MTQQRANCKIYSWDYLRLQHYNARMKYLLYYSVVLRLGKHNEIRSGNGKERKGPEKGAHRVRNGERMTQRNGVSKEGARGTSDKPHNALARNALLILCTRQSRRGCTLVCGSLRAFVACHDCRRARSRWKGSGVSSARLTENPAVIPRSENASRACPETYPLCRPGKILVLFLFIFSF